MAQQGAEPSTTIPPFTNTQLLPSCAVGCGALYDANGACVPPAVPQVGTTAYTSCFCIHATVAPFSTGSTGVCDEACPGEGLASIATWFRNMCGVNDGSGSDTGGDDSGGGGGSNNDNGGDSGNGGDTDGSSGGSSGGSTDSGGGGDWLSNHWQWVIFLVVLVVAIVGIWIGACIWRRRYLKKREQRKFSQKNQSEGTMGGMMANPGTNPAASPRTDDGSRTPGSFMPSSNSDSVAEKGKGRVTRWTGRSAS